MPVAIERPAETFKDQAEGPLLRAFLYDADGSDREVDIEGVSLAKLGKRELLWVDASASEKDTPSDLWKKLDFDEATVERAMRPSQGPSVEAFDSFFRVSLVVVDEHDHSFEPVGVRP